MSLATQTPPKDHLDTIIEAKEKKLAAMPALDRLAHDIHRDYEAVKEGMRAYIFMGIRLHEAKSSLPHGKFLAWCQSNLTISKRHIANAMSVAATLCEITQIEMCNALHICQSSEKNPLFELIDGQSHRQLLSAVQEYRNDPTEDANKAKCEERWAKNPMERDDWEPRVLSGEITYTFAWIGMMGIDSTKDKTRPAVSFGKLLQRNAGSYRQIWSNWGSLPEETRHDGIAKLQDAIMEAPEDVKRALLHALKQPAAIPA
jgi:hypothetical protein